MRHLCLLLVLLVSVSADRIPEFKTSISLKALRQMELDLLKPLASIFLPGMSLPLNLNLTQKIPIIGNLTLGVRKLKIKNFDLDWEGSKFTPLKKGVANQVYLALKQVSVNLTMDLYVKLGNSVIVNSPSSLRVDNLTQTLQLQFNETENDESWGFIPIIQDSTTNVDRISVKFDNAALPSSVINTLINTIISQIPKLAKQIIVGTVGPKLANLAANNKLKFQIPLKFLKYKYQLSIATTQAPYINFAKTNTDSQFNIAVDIGLKNLDTGAECPLFNENSLKDRIYQDYDDIELMLGDNLINQVLWFVIDSKVLNITLSQQDLDKLGKLPLQLTTTGLRLISSSFAEKYGEDKPMYLQIATSDVQPQIFFRAGRVVGGLNLRIGFIVDTDGSQQPLAFKDCKTCEVAHLSDASVSLMLTAFNQAEIVGASIMEVLITEMKSADPVEKPFPFDDGNVASTLNGLINAFVPQINEIAQKGIKNPLVGDLLKIKDLDLILGDTFLGTSLRFE